MTAGINPAARLDCLLFPALRSIIRPNIPLLRRLFVPHDGVGRTSRVVLDPQPLDVLLAVHVQHDAILPWRSEAQSALAALPSPPALLRLRLGLPHDRPD